MDYNLDSIISRPNSKDLAMFTRQLSTLIDADMPLSEGLRTLSRQVEKNSFKLFLEIINSQMKVINAQVARGTHGG